MLKSLRLKGFRRYVDERFTFGPGVCFIDGENNAGKTTLFLAIEYALFGTAGSIRSPQALLHPGASGLGVEIVFTARDGKEYKLQRVHAKPPKARTRLVGHFTLKERVHRGEEVDERYLLSSDFQDREDALALKLAEIARISRRVFDLAVHLRQGEVASILDGDVKLDMALGITAAASANEELRAMALEDEEALGSLPALRASLAHVERERALLAEDDQRAKASLASLESKMKGAEAVLAGSPGSQEDGGELAQLAEALRESEEHREELARDLESAARVAAGEERGDLVGRIRRRQEQAGKAVCAHCGGPIDAARAHVELEQWRARLAEVDALLAGEGSPGEARRAVVSRELRARLEKAEADLAAQRERARKRLEADEVPDDELAAHLEELEDERRMQEVRRSASAQAELEAARGALGEANAALSQKSERLAESERERARLSGEVESLERRARRAEELRILARAFKDLQEQLRTRAASELAQGTLRIHRMLAGAEEIAALSIDPARYQVLVTPHDVGTEVPASQAQGGGHKLLLGLAFRLALAQRLGPFPFWLLDEPTYGLDEKRRNALLERIASLGLSEQILLITHQPMGEAKGQRVVIERSGALSTQRRAAS